MLSYEVPVHYGLISKQQMDEQRFSTTIDEDSFSRENMSVWTGNSNDAWFDSAMQGRSRKLLKCERKAMESEVNNFFYILSIDVARLKANTVITVIKVIPGKEHFKKNVIYIEVINGENFITQQAPRIKELIELYRPKEVVIDANGLGVGLMDAMVLPSFDPKTGKSYPPYYAFNQEQYTPEYKKTPGEEPFSSDAIIYALKANAANDSEIHANLFAQFVNGTVSLLAPERIVKDKLLATKKGQRMDMYDRKKFLLPYEMTSRLVDEINNLRLKPTGIQNQIKVEQISQSILKDRVSSQEYGQYRVKHYEDIATRKKKNKYSIKDLAQFSPKTRR